MVAVLSEVEGTGCFWGVAAVGSETEGKGCSVGLIFPKNFKVLFHNWNVNPDGGAFSGEPSGAGPGEPDEEPFLSPSVPRSVE